MNLFDFFGFLPPILFFGAIIFLSNKFKGKNLTQILEENPALKDFTKALTQGVNPEASPGKKDVPKPDLIPPSVNTEQLKSTAGNVIRGILLIALLLVAAFYAQSRWGVF